MKNNFDLIITNINIFFLKFDRIDKEYFRNTGIKLHNIKFHKSKHILIVDIFKPFENFNEFFHCFKPVFDLTTGKILSNIFLLIIFKLDLHVLINLHDFL